MHIERLKVDHLRNLKNISLNCHPCFNLFIGANGSGKTSLLEAIYIMGAGRSFRTRSFASIIQYEASSLSIFLELNQSGVLVPMGQLRHKLDSAELKIGGEKVKSISTLAQHLPIQLICPDSFELLQGAAELRRQFIDWGLFYSEPSFFVEWQQYKRVLTQRNAAIRSNLPTRQIQVWDAELVAYGERIHQIRLAYVEAYMPIANQVLKRLLDLGGLEAAYSCGWDESLSLSEALCASWYRDLKLRYTSVGPHRADLKFTMQGHAVGHVLSRGQQKMLICGLSLAQAILYEQHHGQTCVFLIDDLAAELDSQNRKKLFDYLSELNSQVFVTGVEADILEQGMFDYPHQSYLLAGGVASAKSESELSEIDVAESETVPMV